MNSTIKINRDQIASNVESAARRQLSRQGYRALTNVACRFRRGTLVLFGEAPTYFQKQIAQEAIRNLEGVKRVMNLITVTPARAAWRDAPSNDPSQTRSLSC
jgi:osmotically-inducible protein OsmY